MHPVSLEFQAFGPYKGKEFISFNDLARDGLFLICGETGSGKTMILDAITFALYGQSSGNNRDDLEQLRCNRCDPQDATYVKFVFEEGGQVYSFERRLEMKRKNLSAKQSALRLNEEGVWVPLFENCKAKEMTAKAAEIIGLNYDQFRQVIILPQGKFEKLLTSKSDEKEAILVSIFGADKWQKIANKYYDAARAKMDELSEVKSKREAVLREEDCATIGDLKRKAEEKEQEKAGLEAEYRAAAYEKKEAELEAKKTLAASFAQLRQLQGQQKMLEARAEEIAGDEAKLNVASSAEKARIPIERVKEAETHKAERKKALEDLTGKSGRAGEAFREAETRLKAHEDRLAERQGWETEKTVLGTKTAVYEQLDSLKEEAEAAEKAVSSAETALADARSKLDEAARKTGDRYGELNAAIEGTKQLRASYMAGITGFIAEELKENEPCPVCGSLTHPNKASVLEGCANKEDVEAAEAKEERARKSWQNADNDRKAWDETVKEKTGSLAAAKAAYEAKHAEFEAAKQHLVEGIASLAALKDRIEKLGSDIARYDADRTALSDACRAARQTKEGLETQTASAKEELLKAEEKAASAEKALQDVLASIGFADPGVAAAAMLTEDGRAELSKKIEQYRGSLKTVREQAEAKAAELQGMAEPDPAQIALQSEEIASAKAEYNRKHGALTAECGRLQEKYGQLAADSEKYEAEIREAEDDLTFAKNLRGDTGIGLQRYVLGIMFSSVIKAANEMLKKVHGGRYQLFRTDDKVSGTNKRGLDLKVYDSYSGGDEGRSVSTLSGGEKFLASLALSIGMSAIAKTGGVNIDGIFIDEGFGSLDNDSIDDALDILSSIQKAHGMVGIISHVEVLRSNIPTKIQVIKKRETSTIR